MPSKNELAEQLQDEYPGAIVHNIYPSSGPSKVKSAQRYRPEKNYPGVTDGFKKLYLG